MNDGLSQLGEFLEKAEGGERAGHKYAQRTGSPGAYQYTYDQPQEGNGEGVIGQTASGQPLQALERGPHSVKDWGEVLVTKTAPGHEDQAPRHLEHGGKHWVRAGYNTDNNTVGYHEYQPGRHVMDPATGFAREAVPVEAKGVAGGLFHVSGLPQKGGGELPDEINDPHHGKLSVRGYNSDSGMTVYHKDVHHPGWNKPAGEQPGQPGQAAPQPGAPQGPGQPPAPKGVRPNQSNPAKAPPPPPPKATPPVPSAGAAQPPRPGSTPQTPLVGGQQPGMMSGPPTAWQGHPQVGPAQKPPTPPAAGPQAGPAPQTPPGTPPPAPRQALPGGTPAPATPPAQPAQAAAPRAPVGGAPAAPPAKPAPGRKPFGKSMGLEALGDWMEKAGGGGHKYLKREGTPGHYTYTYRSGHSYTEQAFHEQTAGASATQHREWGDQAHAGGDNYLAAAHRNMATYLDTGAKNFKDEIKHNLGQHYQVARAKPGDHVHHAHDEKPAPASGRGSDADHKKRVAQARELGRAHKLAGGGSIPANDPKVSKLIEGYKVGEGAADILRAWQQGWTHEHLKTQWEGTKKSLEGLGALGDFLEKAEKIPGGMAAGKSPEDFDRQALSQGQKVEMEHTGDPAKAREIAMDHLTEDPDYYTKLARMEAEKCMTKGDLTPQKARQILHDGTVHGQPITEQQRKYFGAVASGSARKGMEKSMRTGLEALGEYLSKSLEDPMPDNKCDLGYSKSKEVGESPDGGELAGKTRDFGGDRVGDAKGGSGGKPGTSGIDAPSPAKSVPQGAGAGTPEDVGGNPVIDKDTLNDEERDPEKQMTDGKTALEEEVREKSLTPAGQRAMVAREHALKVQELTKSEDVRVGVADHPYMMSSMGDVDAATEGLLKSEFYEGGHEPTLAPPGTVIRKSVLCKSEACGVSYPAFYTSCPECGNGQTVNRLLPHSAHVGGGSGTILEKSAHDPILQPRPEEADVMVGLPENVVVFRTRR